jgi:predicted ATPase
VVWRYRAGGEDDETAHRRGYRFIGALARPGDGPAAASVSAVFGREDALNRLDEAFAAAGTGARQVVFVTGEAGIGKTTLVDRWLDRAGDQHAGRIARGECLEHCGAAEAYLPILDAVGRLCRDQGGEQVVGVLRRFAPTWLAQLPALLGDAEREELARQLVGATPQRMLREMAEALEAMTATAPLVLIVEDLHWSDRSTLDLVAMLARRRETARLLVIGTYRAEDILSGGHPLKTIASELALHRHAVELALPPLSEAAAAQYLGARFPGHALAHGLASLIHRRSEGNPLFMVSLVDELERAGAIRMRDGAVTLGADVGRLSREVPGSVTHVIERQLDRLSDDERRIVMAASVAGDEFAVPIVAAALEADVVQTELTCREVVRRKLLLVPGSSLTLPDGRTVPRFRFIHALYRQALHDAVPIVAKAQLHGRLAVGLEALYGPHVNEVALELAGALRGSGGLAQGGDVLSPRGGDGSEPVRQPGGGRSDRARARRGPTAARQRGSGARAALADDEGCRSHDHRGVCGTGRRGGLCTRARSAPSWATPRMSSPSCGGSRASIS